MIGLSPLDGFSHYIWDFRFKFSFELIECRPYLAIPNRIIAGQAVNGIAFDIIHQLPKEPPIGICREGIRFGLRRSHHSIPACPSIGDYLRQPAAMGEEGDIAAITRGTGSPPKNW